MAIANVELTLESLFCSSTTESGHDEVYFVLGGVDGTHKQISLRGPNASLGADADGGTAWNMNDSGDQKNRTLNALLFAGGLGDGDSAALSFGLMESDGTDYGKTVNAAAALAAKVADNPQVTAIADVVQFLGGLIPSNEDDTLGSFGLSISNLNGRVTAAVQPGSYVSVDQALESDGTFVYRFAHDDGDYTAHFKIKGLTAQDAFYQADWRSCSKCQSLFFGPFGGICPTGGSHDASGSFDYISIYNAASAANLQNSWQSCKKCQCLHFTGFTGACAAGGTHDDANSFRYSVLFNCGATSKRQNGWQSCVKCRQLFFGPFSSRGHCAAGGRHDGQNSYDYSVDFT